MLVKLTTGVNPKKPCFSSFPDFRRLFFIFPINFLGVTRIRTYIWHGSDHESSKLATGLTAFIEAEHAPLFIDKWKSRRYL